MTPQIVEKSGPGLSRVYDVTIPAGDLVRKLEAKAAEMAPKMNLRGFRPGKVPVAHVKRMYGKELMGEIVQETLNATNQKVLDDNKIRPAGQPELKPVSDMDKVLEGKSDLNYEFAVEVMPEFALMDLSKVKLKKPVYALQESDVDEALKELSEQSPSYKPRTGKAAKAKLKDQLIIDFIGRIDGEAFEGGTDSDAPLVLGSNQYIPGFEDQLVGAKAGDKVTVKVTFPEDYPAETLKGKAAEFEVTVKEVRAPEASAIDDDLAKAAGFETLDKLKQTVRENLTREFENASRFKLKRALLDELDAGHSFELPQRMVDAEFDAIWRQVQEDEKREGRAEEDKDKTEDQLKAEYRKIAERRVRLGLVLAEMGRARKIVVPDQEILQALQQEAIKLARQYNMEPQQVYDSLRQNTSYLAQVRAPLFEQKVVDALTGEATVTDKKVKRAELFEDDDLPEGYAS